MRSPWFVAALVLFSTLLAYSQTGEQTSPEGKVTGTVLDEQGQPIDNAQVCTHVSLPGETIETCSAQSDGSGQFQMDHLPMGTFGVVASKDEDGYAGPNPSDEIQTVTLTPEAPMANVVLKLGPKGGILVPSVRDKVTGKPVYGFVLSWWVDGTEGSWSGGAGFSRWTTRTSIPAEKDVIIGRVSARGYKTWVASDQSNPSGRLHVNLHRGEYKSLSIELEPEAKDGPTAQ